MAIKRKCNKKFLHSTAILLVALLFASLFFNIPYTMNATAETGTTDVVLTAEEVLIVHIYNSQTDASGDTDEFVRNFLSYEFGSNNAGGFVAYMNTITSNPSLTNISSGDTIPTLAANSSWTRASSVTNFWGYCTMDVMQGGTYYPMVGSDDTPILVASGSNSTSASGTLWFGAKIDSTKDSGTYTNTVVFTVISGTNTIPSEGPQDPATPQDTSEDDPVVDYDSNGDQTIYTTTNYGGTYSEVSAGDNRASYPDATEIKPIEPKGVTTYITEGTPLTTGLAVTAATAAVSGVIFLIATRRRDDEDEEEEQQ